jgi:hypothetical protein
LYKPTCRAGERLPEGFPGLNGLSVDDVDIDENLTILIFVFLILIVSGQFFYSRDVKT